MTIATITETEKQGDTSVFSVKYDGPSVASGRMDARDLAPVMLATAELFQHTASLTNGVNSVVRVEIDADFKRGSFGYTAVAVLVTLGPTLLGNLSVSDVLLVGNGLIDLVRRARGRKPQSIKPGKDTADITFHDGDNITVNINIGQLFMNPTIRKDVEKIVEPLKQDGITDFYLTSPSGEVRVTQDEIDYFEAPEEEEEVLQDKIGREIVLVVSPHFKEGNKWRFQLAGGESFWARIVDKDFMDKVRKHEITFGAGDALEVDMRVRVTRKATGQFERLMEVITVIRKIEQQSPPSLFE